jgi:hypothetical protein
MGVAPTGLKRLGLWHTKRQRPGIIWVTPPFAPVHFHVVGRGAVQPEGLGRNSPRATPWVNAGSTDLLYAVFVQALKGRYGNSHARSPAGISTACRHDAAFDEPSAWN